MSKKLLSIGMCLLSVSVSAQQVISTQGDSYSNATNTIDFTIGEPVTATVSNGTNHLTQGFHQTNLVITGIKDFAANIFVNVFPNPTADIINLSVDKYEGLTMQIFDASGKLIDTALLKQSLTSIKVSEYIVGTYLMVLSDNKDKEIKTFKIIKS